MAADGSIIIETRLDTEGIDSGLGNVKKAIAEKMGDAEDAVNSVMDAIAEAISSSDAAKGGENIISALAAIFRGGGTELSSAARFSVGEAGKGISTESGSFTKGGATLINAAAGGILGAAGIVADAIKTIVSGGKTAAESSSEGFKRTGQNLMSALRAGIAAGESGLCAKAAAIAAAVLNKFKSIFKIHSPSRVFRDEIGKMLMLGLEEGISSNAQGVLEALADLSADMLDSEKKYLEEKERINKEQAEIDERERVREYEKKYAAAKTQEERDELMWEERLRLKKEADKKYLEQLKTAADNERDVMDQLKKDITATYKDIAEYAESSLEGVIKSRDKLSEKLKSYAEGTNGYIRNRFTYEETERTNIGARKKVTKTIDFFSLADQQESIDMLARYGAALETIKQRLEQEFSAETARGFMAALAEMEVEEAAEFAQVLGEATETEFSAFIEKWAEKNSLAEMIADRLYGDQFKEAVDDSTKYMKDELEKLGLEVPEGFFASGSLSAAEFGKGFTEGIDKVLEDTRKLIDSFGNYAVEVVGGGDVINNNNFYSNYSINGTKSTAAESIYAAEAAAVRNKYRGIDIWS